MALPPKRAASEGSFDPIAGAQAGLAPGDALRTISSYMTEDILIEAETREGIASAGTIADGMLNGITTWLVAAVGPEAAYATLARHADEAAVPLLTRR